MKKHLIVGLFLLFAIFGYGQGNSKPNLDTTNVENNSVDQKSKKHIKYSDKQLTTFLDSIGKISTAVLMDKASFRSDSIFKNQLKIDKVIDSSDFEYLKKAIRVEKIDIKTANRIFGNINIDTTFLENDSLPITFFSFNKNKNEFNEYAICLGSPNLDWRCELYFFKGNKILTKHNINHRYGLELEHFTDADSKTVIYYKENYVSGSGIWWFNFYFYKFYNNELIPVLNELQNGNLQYPWGFRVFWLESFIKKKNPLTLKMVYYLQLPDSTAEDGMQKIIDDSTVVTYIWDEKSKTFKGNYEKSKITSPQIMSYYVEDNEILFINAYYKILKACLLDKKKRLSTLNYLNEIKNYYYKN